VTVIILILAPREGFLAFSNPPASGDWIVTGTETYHDVNIVLNGNLVVEDGGSLTLRKVTLRLNSTSGTHYSITVQTGGQLYVLEGSIITSVDSANGYSFVVSPDSTFRMSYSELHYCGWDPSGWLTMGLYILTDDAVVENCLISRNNFFGISFESSATIRNNNITKNKTSGIDCGGKDINPSIYNNYISWNNETGISIGNANSVIQGNTITNNAHEGIRGHNCSLTILGNSISQNNDSGIKFHYSNVTIQNNIISYNGWGIQLDHSNLTIEENFFSNATMSWGLSSGIIRGNTFTNCLDCIDLSWSSPVIQGNILTNNTGTGIWCTSHSNPTIQGNLITFNGGFGIGCREGSQPKIHQNDIYGQNNYGLCNEDDSVTVNATYNYWGSESGPALGQADAADPEEINGTVLFNPWLTESIIVAEIATPLQGETVSSTVKMSVNVRAKNGVSMVEFYVDSQLKYTDFDPPYEWDWDTTQYAETLHEIMVKVIDNFYAFAAYAFRTVYVDNMSPTVSIEEPVSGNICHGTVTINANATDNREISNVRFKVDNGAWLVMNYNFTDFLWKYDLNTTSLSDGQHTLMVLALDKAGNPTTTSTTVLIDNNSPTLTIQSPASGMTVGLTLIISVQANDASNISRIEFYLQDVLVYTATTTPYQWSWDTTECPNGEYTIEVKAYDTVGHVQTRQTAVTVKNVESPWWEVHMWTIIQVLVAIGGLMLAVLTYLTRKKEKKKETDE